MTTPAGTAPAGAAAASPLRAVLDELTAGAPTLEEVARRTGLRRDVVSAAVDHLVRLGRVDASTLSTGCPTDGCGTCPAGSDAGPTCGSRGTPGPAGTRPVLVSLSVRRRPPAGTGDAQKAAVAPATVPVVQANASR